MSYPLAILNLHIACQSLVPQNYTDNYVMSNNGNPRTLNSLGLLNLYIACNFLAPRNFAGVEFDRDAATLLDMSKLPPELPEGYTKFLDVGSAFKLYTNKKSWNDARKHCIAEGGYLAVIDSLEKAGHVKNMDASIAYIWVGFHKLFGENNEWVEVKTGLPPTMIAWASSPYTSDQNYKCAIYDRDQRGLLRATVCREAHEFFCEIPI